MTVVGRDAELRRLEGLAAPGAAGVLVVVGDAGIGKTTLVELAARAGRRAGRTVLAARGAVGERDLAFAALHQLLLPVLDRVPRLPGPQRRAVGGAFGLVEDGPLPDRLHLAAGVLTLLTDAADEAGGTDHAGVLVVADDLHWFDDASRDVLLFCARRLVDSGGPTALVAATRPGAIPVGLPLMELAPLDDDAAARLLDDLPEPPGTDRHGPLLRQAAGNPLALVELARTDDAGEGASGAATLGARERVERSFAARLPLLPPLTRRLVLLAAAADSVDPTTVVDAARSDDATDLAAAWAPAEEAGLLHVDGDHVRFRHPLARAVVYDEAPLAERRGAHLALAEATVDPDRRAWHLAAAALGPDEDVAADLEATADRARLRGGWVAAARALERAGELTPEPGAAARRFLLAAPAAMYTGRTAWVERLTARARASATDDFDRLEADRYAGWAASTTTNHVDAVGRLTTLARETADDDPYLAVAALVSAGVSAYNAGDESLLDDVAATLDLVHPEDDDHGVPWLLGVVSPFSPQSRAALERAVAAPTDLAIDELNTLGGAAWVLDEHTLAERLLSRLLELFAEGPTLGTNALVTGTLADVRLDLGRWEEARAGAEDTIRIADETGMPVVRAQAHATVALVAAHQGRGAEAQVAARAALSAVDPDRTRAVGVRARRALALVALSAGAAEDAHDLLRRAFNPAGGPVHRHGSMRSLVPLVTAAVRSDRTDDARHVLDVMTAHVGPEPGPRVVAELHHARGLLAGPEEAEALFRAALADPAAAVWPFERALVRLDLGERLRRARRVSESRTELSAALETFVRLGAVPFVERATAELRASGVKVADRAPDVLEQLTAQQRRIVRLAAQGRTNRQIAEELFLSPRTVGFHLYRVFPVLGVTSRMQLRDLVDAGA